MEDVVDCIGVVVLIGWLAAGSAYAVALVLLWAFEHLRVALGG